MAAVGEEEDAILSDVLTILSAVAYAGIDAANIKIREMPKRDETLDHLPAIFISGYDDVDTDPLDMEGGANRIHRVQILLVDAHEGDYATDRKKRQKWHKQTLNAIEFNSDGSWRLGLENATSVWSIRPIAAPTFDRSKLPEGYAVFGVVVEFWSQE